MKNFSEYILEEKAKKTMQGDIKFTIWEKPDKKVQWLDDNKSYQKIEYQYKTDDVEVHFLLGFKYGSWKLWVGKIGAASYDDDPYCSFDTTSFAKAIIAALDKVEKMVNEIKSDKRKWIQYYIHL